MIQENRILVVDDDPGVRDSYKEILVPSRREDVLSTGASLFDGPKGDEGSVLRNQYDLVLADRGEEGVKAVEEAVKQKTPFSAAFVDMKMPGIDGAETARRIWKIDPNMNIVIVTAYSEYTPDDVVRVTGRDDIFYLRKPFNPEEIRQFARSLAHQWALEREREFFRERLEGINANLEALVRQRTAELREAYERVTALDQEKMAFLRYLSHEVNTPLNWIRVTGAMNREDLSDEDKELLDIAEKGFDRLNGLTKAVLSYFELAGSINPELENVSVKKLLSDILEQKNGMVQASDLEIITRLPELQEVKADYQYFKELIGIILDNALAFSRQSGTITLKADLDDEKMRLIIADNGKGIEKEDLEKIFKPFTIEEFKRREGGYGLNLPRAKIIAEAHGWQIWAESEGKGHGARLVLEISSVSNNGQKKKDLNHKLEKR